MTANSGGNWRIGVDHDAGPHLLRLFFGEQPLVAAGNLAVAELRQEPAAHVVGADREAAGGRGVLGDGRVLIERRLRAQAVDRSAASAVRTGVVGIGLELGVGVGRVVHSERARRRDRGCTAPTSRR